MADGVGSQPRFGEAVALRLPTFAGFYGLAKCDEYVRKYMAAARPKQRVYGLLPTSCAA